MTWRDAIPLLRPREPAGPFEPFIPRTAAIYVAWMTRTTRRERLLMRLRLMPRARRREILGRLRDVIGPIRGGDAECPGT